MKNIIDEKKMPPFVKSCFIYFQFCVFESLIFFIGLIILFFLYNSNNVFDTTRIYIFISIFYYLTLIILYLYLVKGIKEGKNTARIIAIIVTSLLMATRIIVVVYNSTKAYATWDGWIVNIVNIIIVTQIILYFINTVNLFFLFSKQAREWFSENKIMQMPNTLVFKVYQGKTLILQEEYNDFNQTKTGKTIKIGRSEINDIIIKDPFISRELMDIKYDPERRKWTFNVLGKVNPIKYKDELSGKFTEQFGGILLNSNEYELADNIKLFLYVMGEH